MAYERKSGKVEEPANLPRSDQQAKPPVGGRVLGRETKGPDHAPIRVVEPSEVQDQVGMAGRQELEERLLEDDRGLVARLAQERKDLLATDPRLAYL